MTYRLRYRDYKNNPGTYLIYENSKGKQMQMYMVAARRMSKTEQRQYLEQLMLAKTGYIANGTKYTKQLAEDHIREVSTRGMNTTITDIRKDPQTKRWKREKVDNRDYYDNVNPDEIERDDLL